MEAHVLARDWLWRLICVEDSPIGCGGSCVGDCMC